MADKPPVLVLAGRYRPGYRSGGPVASVENLVHALGDEFAFRVLALDHDLGEPIPYPPETLRSEAVYLPLDGAAKAIRSEIKNAKKGLIYVQTPFDPLWGLLPLALAPRGRLLIAPRGQFAPGALAIGRRKKQAALAIMRASDLGRLAWWQATAESDREEMVATAPWIDPQRILLAPNLPSDPGFTARRKPQGRLKAIYVGRIDPKKNLLTAVRAAVAADVDLEVVGPAEDVAYAELCRKSGNERVTFAGPLPPDEVRRKLAEADVFLFPTLGENYGHSIVEAMLSGLPAVIGDTTPWRGLEARKAGFDLPPDDVDGFTGILRRLVGMREEEYVRWSEGARATIEALIEWETAVETSRRMLWKAFENGN